MEQESKAEAERDRPASRVRRMVGCAIFLVVSLALGPTGAGAKEARAASAPIPTFASLLDGFAQMPGLTAQVREERHLTLLREPLVSYGALYYAPPDRLARHVHSPAASRLVVTGDRVRYGTTEDGGEIDLEASPALQTFVDAFRRILSGDVEGLKKIFVVQYMADDTAPDSGSWRVSLHPRNEPLKRMIQSLEITGRDRILSELSIREIGGDWTKMTFSSVDPDRRFSTGETSEIFRLAPP